MNNAQRTYEQYLKKESQRVQRRQSKNIYSEDEGNKGRKALSGVGHCSNESLNQLL